MADVRNINRFRGYTMNEQNKEKKPYIKPELEVVNLDSKMDLLQASCEGNCFEDDIGSTIPVFIDPSVSVGA